MDDDAAIIDMVDYNLYREEILPSELGLMFRLRLDARNRQGQRSDLTSVHGEQRLNSRDELGKKSGLSGATVYRYMRLTYLVEPLLKLVDDKKLSIVAAAELSHLEVEQEWLYRLIEKHQVIPSKEQAKRIKETYKKHKLTLAELDRIMQVESPLMPKKVVFDYEDFIPFFPENTLTEQIKQDIKKLLKHWKNSRTT